MVRKEEIKELKSGKLADDEPIAQVRQFIDSNPTPRELKRALAIKLSLENYSYRQIKQILNVSIGFTSKWKQNFNSQGIEGLKSRHKGRKSYLNKIQKREVIDWLNAKQYYQRGELEYQLAEKYELIYKFQQSYYQLFKEAR